MTVESKTDFQARVALARCSGYQRAQMAVAMKALLDNLGGMSEFVKPGQRVLLKPNLIVPRSAEAAVTTHPEVVRAVARMVLEAGGKPFIGDSPAFSSAWAVAKACGIADVAEELGLEIVDLSRKARMRRVGADSPFQRVSFGSDALEADAIINLPKIKTHCQMGMSLGAKNMYGTVAGKRKCFFHFLNGEDPVRFGKLIIAILRYTKPVLTIADGIVSLERYGPTSGDPRATGFLAASGDTIACDRVVMEILGVPQSAVYYMKAAQLMGYGCQDLHKIEVLGEKLEGLRIFDYVKVQKYSPINFTLPRVIKSTMKQALLLMRSRFRG
ncbi:MAG: DUF362 domain-containing protein [Candidatus Sumerlaeia bacterium]